MGNFNHLIPYQNGSLVPQEATAASAVLCVPGCGVSYIGSAALYITSQAVGLTSSAGIIEEVLFESIVSVRDMEFRGLVLPRQSHTGKTKLIVPAEAFGVEISYRGLGPITRYLRALTFYADTARQWADLINMAVAIYHDSGYLNGTITFFPDRE